MRKLILILALLMVAGGGAVAQQLPQFSQYLFNEYFINPAWGGSRDYFEVRSANRYQWIGITDAPRTYTITLHGPNKARTMGFGGQIFTDIVGPTRRIGLQGSYSYHFKLNDNIKLSMGLSFGILQWLVDGSKITLKNNNDAVISSGLQSALVPDATFGILLYEKEKWYFGISLPNLTQSKLYFFNYQTESLSRLEDHYYANGAYKFNIGEDFQVEPSFMLKYVHPAPLKLDLGVRAIYQEMVWLGAAFRTHDAWSVLAGFMYKKNLLIGYSYDFTTTNIRNYSTGTHELVLGVKFTGNSVAKGEFDPSMY
jgi:type IX secretion system PorP/SprF family membrane protein